VLIVNLPSIHAIQSANEPFSLAKTRKKISKYTIAVQQSSKNENGHFETGAADFRYKYRNTEANET